MSTQKQDNKTISCGLIMPISSMGSYNSEHWVEIKNIITEAIEGINGPKFKVNLVSEANDIGVIQKRIVQNIYNSDIIVCDVSGKNPNVMFELGMRLAFDKPTVIVKDNETDYSFDTGIIEHISYPRDLRFSKIVMFKNILVNKVSGTYEAALTDPNHSPFLKNFGEFKVANFTESVIPAEIFILEQLSELQRDVKRLHKPEIFKYSDNEKIVKMVLKIKKMVDSDIYNETIIEESLIDYGMPKEYVKGLVDQIMLESLA